jgi:carboxypeptidase Taq
MKPSAAYEQLVRLSRERALLASCIELLSWDELTCMPRGGVEHRGRQMAYLSGLLHEQSTDPRLSELLSMVEDSDLTSDRQSPAAVNARIWRRNFQRLTRLPKALVEELADVSTTSQQVWAEARQNDDFGSFLPQLDHILKLKRAEAECLANNGHLYDALLLDYEPGATADQLRTLFSELRPELMSVLAECTTPRSRRKAGLLRREFPIERQRILAHSVAAVLGFDFDRGRIDTTAHPFFSPIGPGDCRITTRFSSTDFGEAFFSMLHELGHGLYEQGLDPEAAGTPMGEAPSLGLHESQSRLWENGVGRSVPFWRCFYPRVKELFHDALHDVTEAEFLAAINHVQPGINRVRADPVTYDLHVMIRFELEQALLTGDLGPSELPGAWTDQYRAMLGVAPPNDAEGCLQDSQWSSGQIGYFPTYSLGNIFGAQLIEAAHRDIGGLDEAFEAGDFAPLLSWLQARVYSAGQRLPSAELVAEITGEPPNCAALVRQIRARRIEQDLPAARRSRAKKRGA